MVNETNAAPLPVDEDLTVPVPRQTMAELVFGTEIACNGYVGTVVATGHGGVRVRWSDGKIEFLHGSDLAMADWSVRS